MGRDRGFAAATNAAFGASTAEHVLILNPDCVMDPACAAALRDHLIARPDVGLAAALLHDPNGTPQLHARRDEGLGGVLWAFTAVGRRVDARRRVVSSLRRYAARHRDRPRRAALALALLADAGAGAALCLARCEDPREVRGTLGGLGLPGGPAPLLTPVRRVWARRAPAGAAVAPVRPPADVAPGSHRR